MGAAEVMAKVSADVQQFGWHCLRVSPRVGEDGPVWSYTIGLCQTFGHPEIAIFGLDSKVSHGILTDCVDAIRAGMSYPLNAPVGDVVGGDYAVEFRAVKPEHLREWFGAATRYYDPELPQVTVMFWPTKEGLFPWQTSTVTGQEEALNVV